MKNDNIQDKIKELFGDFPNNFSVLEEQIDIDLQMEYFEFSKKIKENIKNKKILRNKEDIFKEEVGIKSKKTLLVELATIEDVEVYRVLEKYVKNPDKELKEWSTLALQESRMLLESKLLDTNQVFISTGLGGKGLKLRYFVVFISKNLQEFTDFHKRIIKSELEDYLTKFNSEIEKIDFYEPYASFYVVMPINISINEVFNRVISECNQYGGFLEENFILTNVKHLTYKEIDAFIKQNDFFKDEK